MSDYIDWISPFPVKKRIALEKLVVILEEFMKNGKKKEVLVMLLGKNESLERLPHLQDKLDVILG